MQCPEFKRQLPVLLAEALTTLERDAAEAHLEECAACRQLFARFSQEQPGFVIPDAGALTRRILQAIGPDPCATSENLLGDLIDGVLDAEQARYLNLHLTDCARCTQLHTVLAGMAANLSLLAEREPPAGMLESILRQTRFQPEPARQPSVWAQCADFCLQLLKRPRFPLEASFAATVLWVSAFGIPAPVSATAFAEPLPVRHTLELAQDRLGTGFERLTPAFENRIDTLNTYRTEVLERGVDTAQQTGSQVWDQLSDWAAATVDRLTDETNTANATQSNSQ